MSGGSGLMATILFFKKRTRSEWIHDNPFASGAARKRISEVVKTRSSPIRRNISDHLFTIAGFGCISAASFIHSVFTGLLTTGILFLVFEFKVSD